MVETRLELSLKACLIGLLLAIIFCGTNVYLGLKIGSTISASVPAAVLAMGFLRLFKKYSILENSISQTTASVGESMASSVIFVFPAFLILHLWNDFNKLDMVMSILPGGLIGIVYSIILRNVLLSDTLLGFPEGQAIGKVLNATEKQDTKDGSILMLGMILSGLISFCQIGLQVLSSGISGAKLVGNKLLGGGVSFSVAIISAGYLVGFVPMFVAFISLIFAWGVLLPIFANIHGISNQNDLTGSAFLLWKNFIRPIGVGVFIFTGFSTMAMLGKQIILGIKESAKAIKDFSNSDSHTTDLPFKRLIFVVILAMIPIIYILYSKLVLLNTFGNLNNFFLSILITLIMLVVGFGIAAVSGYFAGLAGSTSSPVSGLLFIAVIVMVLILNFVTNHTLPNSKAHMLELIIMMVGVIAGMAVITNGSIQDYKSGQIVGSNPSKQQIALFLGIFVSAIVAPLFISLVYNAYGIAGIVPHIGMDPNKTLSAPQASAVAALTNNILGGSQNWNLILIGVLIGFIGLIIDIIGRKTGKFRCSLVSIGMGIYLPPDIVTSLFIGGCIKLIVDRKIFKIKNNYSIEIRESLHNRVNLLVCGLIAGESLMGLFLAVPFIIKQSSDALKIVNDSYVSIANFLSVIVVSMVLFYIYRTGTKYENKS